MQPSLKSGPVVRAIVRSILVGLSMVNVTIFLASMSVANQVVQLSCVAFAMVTSLLYILDASGRVVIDRRIALLVLFINSCVVGFLFDLNPTPIYVFIPSFICSIVVLYQASSIRTSAIFHFLATVVCFTRGEGDLELTFLPMFFFGIVLGIFFIASYLAFVSSEKYYADSLGLKDLLKQKGVDIEAKAEYLRIRNEKLKTSHAQLRTRVKENSERMLHLTTVNGELGLIAKAAGGDMKSPLKSIETYINELGQRLDELELKEGFSDYLEYVADGANRMNAMVDDLLEYCDPSVRKITHQNSTQDVLTEIQSNLNDLLLRENAQLIVQPDMPEISGHKTEILQLFQNLITNGIKFRRPGVEPICKVGFSRSVNEICFHVSDNGIGIPPNRVKDVFGLFTRLHDRGNYEGTGIGLALCRRIVIAAGGEIWAESEEGVGTTFFFTWPLLKKSGKVPERDRSHSAVEQMSA